MRKVEQQIVQALKTGRSVKLSERDEVETRTSELSRVSRYRLWGTVIAEAYYVRLTPTGQWTIHSLHVRDGRYRTVTTKSRINAVLQGFASPYRVYQQRWNWYYSKPQGAALSWPGEMTLTPTPYGNTWVMA